MRGREEYGMLYDTHQADAYRLALLLTGNDAPLAEDIVSDAFVAVYPRWRDGKVDHFEQYLLRTVANRVKGSFRRLAVERRHAVDSLPEVGPGHEHPDIDADLWEALRALPQKQRTAVVLFYYQDMPIEEVAETMGTSTGTVKAHLSRGRDRLRVALAGVKS
jgi:RNA polymerase sigma-70 factor (sigma-E family)